MRGCVSITERCDEARVIGALVMSVAYHHGIPAGEIQIAIRHARVFRVT